MRFYLYTFLLTILLITPNRPLHAQETRHENSGLSLIVRPVDGAAKEQNVHDWPVLRDSDTGTQVHLSFDLRNADVILVTNKSFGRDAALEQGRTIAQRLNLPKADFITYETGKTMVAVDLELNDYLQREGNTRTRFDFDLARLQQTLDASTFPRPFYYVVKRDGGETVTLASDQGETPLTREYTFFRQSELPAAHLKCEMSVPWYGYVILLVFGGLMLGTVVWLPFHSAQVRRKNREKALREAQAIPDPEKVQQQYNKMLPMWLITLGIPVLMGGLFLTGGFEKGLRAFATALQSLNVPLSLFPLGMIVLMGISQLASFLINKSQEKREGITPEPLSSDEPPRWTLTAPLLPMFLVFPLMMLAMPGALFNFTSQVRLIILGCAFGGILIGVPLISWYARRFTHTTLPPGDIWHDRVQQLAEQVGVKVKRVEVQRSKQLNAYATLTGTVGLTSSLLKQLEPEEIDVIILHELAHHKTSDPRRGMLFSLLTTGVFLLIWIYGTDYVQKHYTLSRGLKVLLQSPIFVIFILPVLRTALMGKSQRKKEQQADQFAVDVTGDPELVIRALTKIHTLSAIPHQLKPSDELLNTHPSLVNRIAAIRRYAKEEKP